VPEGAAAAFGYPVFAAIKIDSREVSIQNVVKNIGIAKTDFIIPGVLRSKKLVNVSKHNYALEPNVRFRPHMKMIIFMSNMFGTTYVFRIEVAKAVN